MRHRGPAAPARRAPRVSGRGRRATVVVFLDPAQYSPHTASCPNRLARQLANRSPNRYLPARADRPASSPGRLAAWPPDCLDVRPSWPSWLACLPVCLSACLPVCLSACLPVCLSACLPVCLSACLPLPACLPGLPGLSVCPAKRLALAGRDMAGIPENLGAARGGGACYPLKLPRGGVPCFSLATPVCGPTNVCPCGAPICCAEEEHPCTRAGQKRQRGRKQDRAHSGQRELGSPPPRSGWPASQPNGQTIDRSTGRGARRENGSRADAVPTRERRSARPCPSARAPGARPGG